MRITAVHCPTCRQPTVKWNHHSVLPNVGSWLTIEYAGELLKVRRISHIEKRGDDIKYEDENGNQISGKYRWRYC